MSLFLHISFIWIFIRSLSGSYVEISFLLFQIRGFNELKSVFALSNQVVIHFNQVVWHPGNKKSPLPLGTRASHSRGTTQLPLPSRDRQAQQAISHPCPSSCLSPNVQTGRRQHVSLQESYKISHYMQESSDHETVRTDAIAHCGETQPISGYSYRPRYASICIWPCPLTRDDVAP